MFVCFSHSIFLVVAFVALVAFVGIANRLPFAVHFAYEYWNECAQQHRMDWRWKVLLNVNKLLRK